MDSAATQSTRCRRVSGGTLAATLRLWLYAVFVLLTACATGLPKELSTDDIEAIKAAQAFVTRHGFTDVPHPLDQPVQNVGLFDSFGKSPEELLKERHNTLQPNAFAFDKSGDDEYLVFFKTKDLKDFRGIRVIHGDAIQVVASLARFDKSGWRDVPPILVPATPVGVSTESAEIWLQPPPSYLGKRSTWVEISHESFTPVLAEKFSSALAILDDLPILSLDLTSVTRYAGRSFKCNESEKPYLVCAEYMKSIESYYTLFWAGTSLVIVHDSIGGRNRPDHSALVVCLANRPAEVLGIAVKIELREASTLPATTPIIVLGAVDSYPEAAKSALLAVEKYARSLNLEPSDLRVTLRGCDKNYCVMRVESKDNGLEKYSGYRGCPVGICASIYYSFSEDSIVFMMHDK